MMVRDASTPMLVGINHRSASLVVREAMSFDADETVAVLQAAAAAGLIEEAAILSTCNRTEFYLAPAADTGAPERQWLTWMRQWRPRSVLRDFERQAYCKTGPDAARHLFRVAAGLDSSVLGDVQIQHQVRDAMRLSSNAGTLRSQLNQLMGHALRAGRRARRDTTIAFGSPTIGSAVVRLLEGRLAASDAPAQPVIVVVGAGKAARPIARLLARRGGRRLVFVNRTRERAARLAAECGGEVQEWSDLPACVGAADVIITATSAPEPLLTRERLLRYLGGRSRPLLIIDPSVPRNVEACSGVEVIDIDSVKEVQAEDLATRERARPSVEAIVEEELDGWRTWAAHRPVEEAVRRLHVQADALARELAARYAPGPEELAETTARLRADFRRLLHDHVRDLRDLDVMSPNPRS